MSKLKIRWIGQSGYLLSDGETTICIDPYLSDVVNRVANRPRMVEAPFKPSELKADAVVCTHDHLDHVDIDAIPDMPKEKVEYLAPSECEGKMRDMGVIRFVPFDIGSEYKKGNFKLKAVFADHSVYAVGVVAEHSGITMYFTGDTEYNEKLKEVKCDILFVCINGKLGNMNVNDAIKLTNEINPKVGIPTHYGMFESNTEDPSKYTSRLECGFEMKYNEEYSIEDIIRDKKGE